MKFNPIEIFKAWVIAANPSKEQKELAEARMNICLKCDFRKEIIHNKKWSTICGRCGCPLQKKVFTDEYGTCPLQKWNSIEEEYIKNLKVKSKTII